MAQFSQYFFGHDSDLQAMKECILHGKPNEFYRRSDNTPICKDCMKEIERRAGHQGVDDNIRGTRKPNEYGL